MPEWRQGEVVRCEVWWDLADPEAFGGSFAVVVPAAFVDNEAAFGFGGRGDAESRVAGCEEWQHAMAEAAQDGGGEDRGIFTVAGLFMDRLDRKPPVLVGTGGIGVSDQQTMPGVVCTDCHMFVSDVDGSNSAMFHGHTWAITVKEANGESTTSCTHCHSTFDAAKASGIITAFKSSFASLDATAQKNVALAAEAMKGNSDKALQAKLTEAQHNLGYAESDESDGFHNHKYVMALVKDANDSALEILSALGSK